MRIMMKKKGLGAPVVEPIVTEDPYWDNVSLLLDMEEVNGSTVFVDRTLNNTVTPVGTAVISDANTKFGIGSLYSDFNGWLTWPVATNNQFGTGDFTIEFWNYLISKDTNGATFFGNYSAFNSSAIWMGAGHNAGNVNKYQVWFGGSGPSITSVADIEYNKWKHFALVRESGVMMLYIDGISEGSAPANIALNGNGSWAIGEAGDGNPNYGTNGYFDEFRITKGIARYTENFTPPTESLAPKYITVASTMYEVAAIITQLSTSGAYSGYYDLYNAMNDQTNATSVYGPNNWPSKHVHGDSIDVNYEEVLDAGENREFVVGDMTVTTHPSGTYSSTIGTDPFQIYVSDDNATWTLAGEATNETVSPPTQLVSMSGTGRYIKFVILPDPDTVDNNYPRFFMERVDNPWDITIREIN